MPCLVMLSRPRDLSARCAGVRPRYLSAGSLRAGAVPWGDRGGLSHHSRSSSCRDSLGPGQSASSPRGGGRAPASGCASAARVPASAASRSRLRPRRIIATSPTAERASGVQRLVAGRVGPISPPPVRRARSMAAPVSWPRNVLVWPAGAGGVAVGVADDRGGLSPPPASPPRWPAQSSPFGSRPRLVSEHPGRSMMRLGPCRRRATGAAARRRGLVQFRRCRRSAAAMSHYLPHRCPGTAHATFPQALAFDAGRVSVAACCRAYTRSSARGRAASRLSAGSRPGLPPARGAPLPLGGLPALGRGFLPLSRSAMAAWNDP